MGALSGEERRMFSDWLNQINEHEISDNNWLFFRILVNCGLRKNGGCWSEERLSADLARIEDFYLGDVGIRMGKRPRGIIISPLPCIFIPLSMRG